VRGQNYGYILAVRTILLASPIQSVMMNCFLIGTIRNILLRIFRSALEIVLGLLGQE
jgi:hypothetical protein